MNDKSEIYISREDAFLRILGAYFYAAKGNYDPALLVKVIGDIIDLTKDRECLKK